MKPIVNKQGIVGKLVINPNAKSFFYLNPGRIKCFFERKIDMSAVVLLDGQQVTVSGIQNHPNRINVHDIYKL